VFVINYFNHGDTEDTEVAQRSQNSGSRRYSRIYPALPRSVLCRARRPLIWRWLCS